MDPTLVIDVSVVCNAIRSTAAPSQTYTELSFHGRTFDAIVQYCHPIVYFYIGMCVCVYKIL